jgi:hypothetical protein
MRQGHEPRSQSATAKTRPGTTGQGGREGAATWTKACQTSGPGTGKDLACSRSPSPQRAARPKWADKSPSPPTAKGTVSKPARLLVGRSESLRIPPHVCKRPPECPLNYKRRQRSPNVYVASTSIAAAATAAEIELRSQANAWQSEVGKKLRRVRQAAARAFANRHSATVSASVPPHGFWLFHDRKASEQHNSKALDAWKLIQGESAAAVADVLWCKGAVPRACEYLQQGRVCVAAADDSLQIFLVPRKLHGSAKEGTRSGLVPTSVKAADFQKVPSLALASGMQHALRRTRSSEAMSGSGHGASTGHVDSIQTIQPLDMPSPSQSSHQTLPEHDQISAFDQEGMQTRRQIACCCTLCSDTDAHCRLHEPLLKRQLTCRHWPNDASHTGPSYVQLSCLEADSFCL